MGVRQRGASTAKIGRPRHAVRRPAEGCLSGQKNPVSAAGALGRSLSTTGAVALGARSSRLTPPLTPLTASHAPSHATSIPC